jgi:hypothetical protein
MAETTRHKTTSLWARSSTDGASVFEAGTGQRLAAAAPRTSRRAPPVNAREPGPDAAALESRRGAPQAVASVDADRFIARAQSLVKQGDVSAARLLLEHAFGAGSAWAAFLLAETYDRRILRFGMCAGLWPRCQSAITLYARTPGRNFAGSRADRGSEIAFEPRPCAFLGQRSRRRLRARVSASGVSHATIRVCQSRPTRA